MASDLQINDKTLLKLAAKAKHEYHGMSWTPEYQAWLGMKQRCTNHKKREYKNYGGRGIKVCQDWLNSFQSFFDHIGLRPTEKHSIDRIDVNGNYEPGNIRWATQQEQIDNTTVVRMVTIGDKCQSIAAWGREMGLSLGQIQSRESRGWGINEAILTPSIKGQKVKKHVPQGYSKLKNGTFRVMLDGKYIKTVATEESAIAIVRASAEIGKSA